MSPGTIAEGSSAAIVSRVCYQRYKLGCKIKNHRRPVALYIQGNYFRSIRQDKSPFLLFLVLIARRDDLIAILIDIAHSCALRRA